MRLMHPLPIIFATLLIAACGSLPKEDQALKPLSLQLDDTRCDIGKPCGFTGEFERLTAQNPTIPDALYTYDYEDKRCILLIGNLTDLTNYENVKRDITLPRSEFVNIQGRGVDRKSMPEWSQSSVCNDREVAVIIESIESAFLTFHERQ